MSGPAIAEPPVLDAALSYAARGWAVLPVSGKKPLTLHGVKDATTSETSIRLMWGTWPDANVAIATGSVSGLAVVDVDGPEGQAALDDLEAEHGTLPDTPVSLTGRGWHLMFATDGPVKSRKLPGGNDLKADGGYVVAWPSRHPSGRPYRWNKHRHPDEFPLAPLPGVFKAKARKTAPARLTKPNPNRGSTVYGQAALAGEIEKIHTAPEGDPERGRHCTLSRAAFRIGRLVEGGEIDLPDAENALTDAVEAVFPPERFTAELRNMNESLIAGREHPRSATNSGPSNGRNGGTVTRKAPEAEADKPPNDLGTISTEAPPLPNAVWRGAFDSYRQALVKTTEATDALHFGVLWTVVGLVVGRKSYIPHGRFMFPNIFGILIGPTGRGRKTTAITHGRQLLQELAPEVSRLSTASWEGLVDALADTDDCKLLMLPGEFRSLAAKAKQENSGLIPGLTDLYDCPPDLRHKTRGSDAVVNRPFLSILSTSTREWFQGSFDSDAVAGGFLNRWTFFDGEPKPPNAHPSDPESEPWDRTVNTIRQMQERLHAAGAKGLPMALSSEAEDMWTDFYNEAVTWDYEGDEILEQMAQRLQDVCLKLTLTYALLEDTPSITSEQLSAAIAFTRWERQCHERVFAGFGASKQKRVEDRIVQFVASANARGRKVKKRNIQRSVCGKRVSGKDFKSGWNALDEILCVDNDGFVTVAK